MKLIEGMGAGRARWLAVFVVLLCASCAAPVLAEAPKMGVGPARVAEAPARAAEAPSPPEEAPPPAETQPPAQGPITEEVEAVESEEVARDEWLDSPEAIRQREESRTAFDDLIAADAEAALGSVFEEALKQLDGDPSRLLGDVQIEEVVSENGALIPDGEGGSQLLELPIPIRSQVPGKEAKPVDLSLKESDGGFESKTPATDIRLPGTLGGEIEIGDELAISELPGNADVAASRYGDTDLFFANSDTDTDTFIAALTKGVEVFEQLRSPKSPEQFRYGLTLPKGTTLRSDGNGGAEIVDGEGKRVAFVPAPFAVDAQGTDVPVSMEVEGSAVLVSIPHRSMDIAYPLLLDPELVYDAWYWHEGSEHLWGLGQWSWAETADYENGTWCVGTCWGNGLYARSKGENYWYGGNTWGQWIYTAPNSTAYISRAVFWTLFGNVNNCYTSQPHGYVGIYNVYSNSYNKRGVYSPPSFFATSYDTGWAGGNGTRHAIVGIGTGGAASQLACGHDFYVGGAALYQDDPENPGVSASGMPGGWISDATPAFTITANGSDPGLGVRKITFTREGQPTIERPVGCNGTAASRCPTNRTEYFNISALSFDEGKKNAAITVEDVTGKKSTQTWQTYVDMTKPDVTLSGQLAVATDEGEGDAKDGEKWDELSLPVYNLNIKATDIGTESNADHKKRSGVRKIEVLLDDVKKEEWEQACPASSCSMEKTYPLKLNNLSADKHVLKVIATDWIGKKREREIEFEYIPATGMKDEYVMHYFPLPDGEGNEAEEESPARPELAVNVMNGNLVYRERDVDVEGYSVDLEVERYYNSLLPEQENTGWGDGWTLAQTPDLEPEETQGPQAPEEAMMVRTSGAVEGSVELPTAANEEVFDPQLQAVVTKEADGGYEVADETGETDTAIAFDEEGTVEELRTEGLAKVDYTYEEGELAEIDVDDPASTLTSPAQIAEMAERDDVTPSFKYSFGNQGSGNGQFSYATDVAIDPTDGTLWVADNGNERIQHFSAVGEHLGQFASPCPGAVEVDLQGNVYAACSMTQGAIRKYSPTGTLLKQIAGPGTAEGQVRMPTDLALDAEGNLWVAEYESTRVQKFDPQGAFAKSISLGSFGKPWGIDVAPNGDIWIAEPWHHRVSVYDQQGQRRFRFGSRGSGHSQFEMPADVEVDAAGNAWVTDGYNNRIQVFDEEGAYITQFGESGSGEGQLDADWWLRIALGANGDVWLTDTGNHRVQRWVTANSVFSFKYSFGNQGSGNGQFSYATDVAMDPTDGSLWMADNGNERVQHFSAVGEYLGQFASPCPGAVEADLQGHVYVACSMTQGAIRKYSPTGTLLKQIAGPGTAEGQVRMPTDLALDADGNLWVSEYESTRVQKFNPQGEFAKSISLGFLGKPWGIDVAPNGDIWVAEPWHYRVSVYNEQGQRRFRFGSQGSGHSQFEMPADVEVDAGGNAWVTDGYNNRVQVFDEEGAYITQFGEEGSGEGQFDADWWLRVALGTNGDVWLTDTGNHRVQRWKGAARLKPGYGVKVQDDPEVLVEAAGGLVDSVEGAEAGEHVYEHDGDLLTSHEDADGETEYEYDEAGRMTRVELPNGTWAEIEYGETDGRVKKVTVDPAGSAPEKATTFSYTDQPRSTKVILPDAPAITYDIGEDGSVFKSQNALKPPEFEVVSGTLYDVENKETAAPIAVGDYNLVIKAYSEEGIASIQVYANGDQLVSEKTCPQIDEEPEACKKLPDEWVTYTGNHAPGILNLEMVIEDGFEQVASKRFWVNIPYTPPPPPDQPVTPKFAEVLQFREEHGLDLDLDPVQDELELNDRVYDTINDWIQGRPVAVASMERWGAPLRTPEVAELEWRLQYWEQASQALPAWVGANAASTFAGYYLDERAGGKIVVGFTGGQAAATLAALEQNGGLIAGPDRIVAPVKAPQHTLAFLESLESQISAAAAGYPAGLIQRVRVDIPSNTVKVGVSNVPQAQSLLQNSFGAQAPITVFFDPNGLDKKDARQRIDGVMRAGDEIWTEYHQGEGVYAECTASFGAFERGKKPSTGEPVLRMFVLAAGHCAELHSITQRRNGESGGSLYQDIGEVRRSGYETISDEAVDTDVAAIRLASPGISPRKIYQEDGSPLVDVTSVWTPTPGTNLCFSGRTSKEKRCGPMISGIKKEDYTEEEEGLFGREGCFRQFIWGGDSGSPVWVEGTGVAVGVAVRGTDDPNDPEFRPILENEVIERLIKEHGQYTVQQFEEALKIEEQLLIENRETCFVPLKPPPNTPGDGTVFGDPQLAPLHLVTRSNAKF